MAQLLLDTHILIALGRGELREKYPKVETALEDETFDSYFSVASLWEMAIKTRLGKLDPGLPVEMLADLFESYGVETLNINRHHAVVFAKPEPVTRDPFDRILLAQCRVEGMRLVTVDRSLAEHPLAWRTPL
jgi:PIN domain nuclease of toxin-antitoxin system